MRRVFRTLLPPRRGGFFLNGGVRWLRSCLAPPPATFSGPSGAGLISTRGVSRLFPPLIFARLIAFVEMSPESLKFEVAVG
jgi:hypothetical protein